jgi:pyruvate/2-oxoglutarate dehydrogenase complex dihydrolipoamide acyltransferase (E2) component
MNNTDYKIKNFTKSRHMVVEMLSLADHKHIIHGLLEVDVTVARHLIRDYEVRTATQLSFTAFIITCLGKAISEDKMVQAYRLGSNQLLMFDEVDVVGIVECTSPEGEKVVKGHTFRTVDKKTYQDINQEMQDVQSRPIEEVWSRQQQLLFDFVLALPGFLRRLLMRYVFSSPHRVHQLGGTVCVSSIGMFSDGGGWGIPVVPNTLTLTLGGIAEKPGVVEGRIEPREYLSLTISFDHDIIDGAPATRFAKRLKQLIESAYSLDLLCCKV